MPVRQPSNRAPSGAPVEEELSAIRRELAKLQEEIVAGAPGTETEESSDESEDDVPTAHGATRVNESVSSSALLSTDGSAGNAQLRGVLERSMARLERERQQRKQLEKELADLRQDRLRETSQTIDGLERKREELNRITKERNDLREWLDRAVRECRRVADEVVRLRQELDVSEHNRENLEGEVQNSRTHVERLTGELDAVQKKYQNALERHSLLESRAVEHSTSVERVEESRRQRQFECEVMAQQIGELEERLHGQQDAEKHLQLLTECMRQLQNHIKELSRIVRSDHVEEALAGGEMNAPYNLDTINLRPDLPVETIVDDAKDLLRTLVLSVRSLQGDILRFSTSRSKTMESERAAREAEISALHLEKQTQQFRYSVEREELQERIDKLNREIKRVIGEVSDREMAINQEDRGHSNVLQHMDTILQENEELQDKNATLQDEVNEIRQKLRRFKVDWTKVHESQTRLQQLQLEVNMMNENVAALTRENENLKIFLSTVGPHGGSPISPVGAATSPTGYIAAGPERHSSVRGPGVGSPSSQMSPIGGVAPSKSPSQPRPDMVRQKSGSGSAARLMAPQSAANAQEKESFKEWKRNIMTDMSAQ